MPTSKIKKDAREGKGSVPSLEKKWDKAKSVTPKKGGKPNWPEVMSIYENMTKGSSMKLEATARLKTTAAKPETVSREHDDDAATSAAQEWMGKIKSALPEMTYSKAGSVPDRTVVLRQKCTDAKSVAAAIMAAAKGLESIGLYSKGKVVKVKGVEVGLQAFCNAAAYHIVVEVNFSSWKKI